MNGPSSLEAFLDTDPGDVGCGEAMEMLHVYADIYATDPQAARTRFPGITAHLRSCGPCNTDFEGLITALEG